MKKFLEQFIEKTVRDKAADFMKSMDHDGDRPYFEDPVARKTEWALIRKVGPASISRKLVKINQSRMAFRITLWSLLTCIALILFGGAFVGFSFSDGQWNSKFLPQTIIGLAALCGGIWILYSGTVPRVFDKDKGFFWKGEQMQGTKTPLKKASSHIPLENVYALQLISEVSEHTDEQGNQSLKTRYQINLILKDSSRLPVVQHSNKKRIRKDAAALAEFLEIPLWDVSGLNLLRGIGLGHARGRSRG